MTLIEHLENHLGPILSGWNDRSSGSNMKAVAFGDQPFEGVITYSTLGLSNFKLRMNDKSVRQELVFSAYAKSSSEQIASFLVSFAQNVAAEGRALLRGETIGPSAPIILGSLFNSVYCAVPMIFEKDFLVLNDSDPPTVFVWIIPISEEEGNFVRANGWKQFEILLEAKDPDIWDLAREPII